MENFTYCAPTRYEFGRGTVERVGDLSLEYLGRKVMIVFGQNHVKASGLLTRVEEHLSKAGVEYVELGGVQPNPTDRRVYEGIDLARAEGITGLLAVGGGSTIDTAKAIAAGTVYDGDVWDFYCGRATVANALPVGVVLTVPGAGSEGSGNTVITRLDGLHKISIRTDYWLRPKFAVIDPTLTFSLSRYQTAVGIVDMMSHIMERYFSPSHDVDVTDRIAEGLLMAIIDVAPRVIDNPDDYQARANIEWASTLAHNGVAGCGRREDWTSHGLEHELSALYNVAHGAGLAVAFPAWMAWMAHHTPAKVAQLGRRIFGVKADDDREAAIDTVAHLRAFYSATLHMPVNLSELGIENPDIDLLVKKFHEDKGELVGAYHPIDSTASREIYEMMKI